jgi:hypothetical protein
MLVAESVIDLAAARATLARAAALIDEHYAANPAAPGTDEEIMAVFAEGQAAKTFVGDAATRVVDRALALSGGTGYLNGSPLARAYRDVRAGAFNRRSSTASCCIRSAPTAPTSSWGTSRSADPMPCTDPCTSGRSSSGPARPALP